MRVSWTCTILYTISSADGRGHAVVVVRTDDHIDLHNFIATIYFSCCTYVCTLLCLDVLIFYVYVLRYERLRYQALQALYYI